MPNRISIEQDRRDFMRDNPDLYRYIEARVAAREIKSAGDIVSGAIDGHSAANRVWSISSRWQKVWKQMLEEEER